MNISSITISLIEDRTRPTKTQGYNRHLVLQHASSASASSANASQSTLVLAHNHKPLAAMDTPPVTPTSVRQRNSSQYCSRPNVDLSGNAFSGTREDVRSRLEKEIEKRYIDGFPFDIFMEDYLQSQGLFCSWALFCRLLTSLMPRVDNAFSIKELTAYKGLLELSEKGKPSFKKPPPTSLDKVSLLPWLKETWNAISETSKSLKVRSVSAQLDSMSLSNGLASTISDNDETIWFTSTENLLHGAANAKRKMHFGMRLLGQSVAQSSDKTIAWSDVEVVGEVTNQARLDNEKILQFCNYARFAFFNQVDRVFLYGLLIHKEDCYVMLFTSTCIIMARSIKLSNALHVTRLVAALHCVGNVGQGRDLKFRRSWSSVCYKKYGKEECSKLQYTLQYHLRYEHVELELHIIGHLHRTFFLPGRRTHVVLCRVSRNFTTPDAVSVDAGDHVVLKVSAIDKDSYYNESHLY